MPNSLHVRPLCKRPKLVLKRYATSSNVQRHLPTLPYFEFSQGKRAIFYYSGTSYNGTPGVATYPGGEGVPELRKAVSHVYNQGVSHSMMALTNGDDIYSIRDFHFHEHLFLLTCSSPKRRCG